MVNETAFEESNATTDVRRPPDSVFSTSYIAMLGLLYILTFFVSVLGNTVVCYIVYQKPAMRSAINILLATLAMADFLTTALCMPFAVISMMAQKWIFGDVFCNFNAILFNLFVTEGTFVLLTISVDRFMIIVRRKDTLTPRRAKIYIAISWVFSFAVVMPPIFGWGKYTYESGQIQCSLEWPSQNDRDRSYGMFFFILTFCIPLLSMAYCFVSILRTVRRNSTRIPKSPTRSRRCDDKNAQTGENEYRLQFQDKSFHHHFNSFCVICGLWAPLHCNSLSLTFEWLCRLTVLCCRCCGHINCLLEFCS